LGTRLVNPIWRMGVGFEKNSGVQENAGIENKPRRERRSREQIAELVWVFKSSGLNQRKFSENRGIGLSELQRSLEHRASGEGASVDDRGDGSR
jgi:hypothetical protein